MHQSSEESILGFVKRHTEIMASSKNERYFEMPKVKFVEKMTRKKRKKKVYMQITKGLVLH